MKSVSQGDIIKLSGFSNSFLVTSKNAYIRATGTFHVCPILKNAVPGPLHIPVKGRNKTAGTVICEQIKLIDSSARVGTVTDSISYDMIMEISDIIQGLFEYGEI